MSSAVSGLEKQDKKNKKTKKIKDEKEQEEKKAKHEKKQKKAKKEEKKVKKDKKDKKDKDERKKEKKKRKREAELQTKQAKSESDESENGSDSDQDERPAKKKSRKERHSHKGEPSSATATEPMEDAPEDDSDDDEMKAKKEAKKKRKKEKKEKKGKKKRKKAEAKRARDEEVLEAGKRALQEEQDEADAAAEAAGLPAPTSTTTTTTTEAETTSTTTKKEWPAPPPGNVTLLLFYQYVRPSWTPTAAREAENFARDSLSRHGCTGRLRCAREGFNGTLTGSAEGIRAFCEDLRGYDPSQFGSTDFKLVDGLREGQRLKGLKVWHVEELVTYGFGLAESRGVAPLEAGGTHLTPEEWHNKAAEPGTVLIDVRNANENAIGRFQPLNDPSRVLDPNMRTSLEFPEWVDETLPKLHEAKQVLMYCTGGIRCERASALLVQKGLDASKVFQLEGGIHRYLEAFPTGGHWIGKNYTFDRRFAHGAVAAPPEAQVPVGRCCLCASPWDRYQAHKKCTLCRMEVLLCRDCERNNKHKGQTLKCHLCGGPKPSYLPPDDKTIKVKVRTTKPFRRGKRRSFGVGADEGEGEGDY